VCMSPDEMTIDQLAQLEAVYRDKGWDDYADQTSVLRDQRIEEDWDPTYVPEVTPRWSTTVQSSNFNNSYFKSFYDPTYFLGKDKADAIRAQAEKFQKHLAHV
jgi:hypothetical protein